MKLICSTVFAAMAVFSASTFAQGLPTQKMLTIDVAQTIAQEAMAKCRADGYKATIVVVDNANVLKALLRDDGARSLTIDIARLKANTVLIFGGPSGQPANLPPGTPTMPPIPTITIGSMGGMPIMAGDQLIGAVAVSGAPGGAKDAACAEAGLAKVADKLK